MAVRALLISLDFLLLSAPRALQPWLGDGAFPAATILLVVVNVALVVSWARLPPARVRHRPRIDWLVAILAGVMIFVAGRVWVQQILLYPIDAQRADMLVVIQHGIRRVLQGLNPYTIYQVPWDAPLPYGPMLWAPFIVPHTAGADVRFATILGALFVIVLCAIAASAAARRGEVVAALGAILLLAAIAFSPDLRGFMSIGHTTVYWPLLALLAWLMCQPGSARPQRGMPSPPGRFGLAREGAETAALTLGLLIVARTTMVALAPVLMMAIWQNARDRFGRALAILAAAIVLPFLPFAAWDWRALWYALYGSYQNVMKDFVWISTDWVQHTVGVTGPLLSAGWGKAVEAVQAAAMTVVYAAAWVAIRRGRPALPWMGVALLVFSMTTLWPVYYIYLDVFVLFACGAAAQQIRSPAVNGRLYVPTGAAAVLTSIGVAFVVLVAATRVSVPAEAVIDVGTDSARQALYAGFAPDERGDRTFAWITGTRAKILVPGRVRRDAEIVITAQPHLPGPDAAQQLSVTLNGTPLGTMALVEGWRDIVFPAPRRAWRIGVNELDLSLSTAVSPSEAGTGADTRPLSLAVDRLAVRGR